MHNGAMDWDDVRYFLALQRQGTLSGAARELGVNHATVGRRIAALEASVGAALFQKTGDGFLLTAVGESMRRPAREVEAAMFGVERSLRAASDTLSGEVRISTSQLLSHAIVVPVALELRRTHPGLVVDAVEATRFHDLARQEADIALRMVLGSQATGPPDVRVRPLGRIEWALFGGAELVASHGGVEGLLNAHDLPLVLYDEQAPGQVGAEWVTERGARAKIVMRASSMYTVRAAVRAGIACGFLPRIWAEPEGLVQLTAPVHHSSIFAALHPDMAQNARIRLVLDQIIDFAHRHPHLFG